MFGVLLLWVVWCFGRRYGVLWVGSWGWVLVWWVVGLVWGVVVVCFMMFCWGRLRLVGRCWLWWVIVRVCWGLWWVWGFWMGSWVFWLVLCCWWLLLLCGLVFCWRLFRGLVCWRWRWWIDLCLVFDWVGFELVCWRLVWIVRVVRVVVWVFIESWELSLYSGFVDFVEWVFLVERESFLLVGWGEEGGDLVYVLVEYCVEVLFGVIWRWWFRLLGC